MWGKSFGAFVFLFSLSTFANSSLTQDTNQLYDGVQNLEATRCAEYLFDQAQNLDLKPYDHYLPKSETEKSVYAVTARAAIEKLFSARLEVKNKIKEFYQSGKLNAECTLAARAFLRAARMTEEMLLVYQVKNKIIAAPAAPKVTNGTLTRDYPQTIKNPKFFKPSEEVKLKSGDLFLSRGGEVVSALIARIGDEDGMYSHIGIYYKDAKTGQEYMIESLISTGLIVKPMSEWNKTLEGRVAVYRHPDEKLAAAAAQKIFDHHQAYMKAHGKTVPYDFSMDLDDKSKMFCSEVALVAYGEASQGQLKLPTFITTTERIKRSNFLAQMGVVKSQIFSPNDLELEPSFELVAEYRKINQISKLRLHDATMQSLFDWMENYGYKLNIASVLKTGIAKLLGPIFKEWKIPPGIPTKTLAAMAALRKIQRVAMVPEAEKFEKEFVQRTGALPTHIDMMNALNEFRKRDCIERAHGKPSLLHSDFSPDVLTCE